MSRVTYDDLIRSGGHAELSAAKVYRQGWVSTETLERARDYFGQIGESSTLLPARATKFRCGSADG